MRSKRALLALGTITIVLVLAFASAAGAATPAPAEQLLAASTAAPYPGILTAGAVGFVNGDTKAFATFSARAVGPAMPGEDHQPARGFLVYTDRSGASFTVSVAHIHAHSASEAHFGGTIVRASDPALVGMFAHAVAIDGAAGKTRDQFSILVTSSDVHEHGVPVPVFSGGLIVKTF